MARGYFSSVSEPLLMMHRMFTQSKLRGTFHQKSEKRKGTKMCWFTSSVIFSSWERCHWKPAKKREKELVVPASGNIDHPELLRDKCKVERLRRKTFTLQRWPTSINQTIWRSERRGCVHLTLKKKTCAVCRHPKATFDLVGTLKNRTCAGIQKQQEVWKVGSNLSLHSSSKSSLPSISDMEK